MFYDVTHARERRGNNPTDCGDALRAGLLFGIERGSDWQTIGRIGNLHGRAESRHPGAQKQRFDYDEFSEPGMRYSRTEVP